MKGNREGNYSSKKIHQDDISSLNIYVSNIKTFMFIKILLQLKSHVDHHTLVGQQTFPDIYL